MTSFHHEYFYRFTMLLKKPQQKITSQPAKNIIYVVPSFLTISSFGILLCQAPVHIVITLARHGTSKKIGTQNCETMNKYEAHKRMIVCMNR